MQARLLRWGLSSKDLTSKLLITKGAEYLEVRILAVQIGKTRLKKSMIPKEINESFLLRRKYGDLCGDSRNPVVCPICNIITRGDVCTAMKLLRFSQLPQMDPTGGHHGTWTRETSRKKITSDECLQNSIQEFVKSLNVEASVFMGPFKSSSGDIKYIIRGSRLFPRFGAPRAIISDRGNPFFVMNSLHSHAENMELLTVSPPLVTPQTSEASGSFKSWFEKESLERT
ncbi:hypothetical protein Tco_0525605 [Tanacetum coccineum]